MKRTIMLGMALLAAGGIVAVDAVSVSASGHEFIASKAGKTKSKQTDSQVFKTGAGTLECEDVTGTGEVSEGKSTTHKEVFTYKECFAFGENMTVSPAHFEFNANGPVTLENTVIIAPTDKECEIRLEPQTIEHAKYENKSGGKLAAESVAVKIHSKGTGSSCGGVNTEGSYDGAVLGELEGGTIEWK